MKDLIKKALAFLGLWNPARGIKIRPEAKAAALLEYKTPARSIFVETGTCRGDMIEMVANRFRDIYSIEYDHALYEQAKKHFQGKDNIRLFEGDSGEKIQTVLASIREPAVFWLDAHGPGPLTVKDSLHCPVKKELEAIFRHGVKGHVILIDDARLFDLYSIRVIKKIAKRNGYKCIIKDGLFRLYER